MTRILASALSITATAGAILAVAAMSTGAAYADDITIDLTPFVSTRTRAEVRSDVMGQSEALRIASSEWGTQSGQAAQPGSDYTRAEAKADYIASRREVNAFNSEDSGSSYLAKLSRHVARGVVVADQAR